MIMGSFVEPISFSKLTFWPGSPVRGEPHAPENRRPARVPPQRLEQRLAREAVVQHRIVGLDPTPEPQESIRRVAQPGGEQGDADGAHVAARPPLQQLMPKCLRLPPPFRLAYP
jgi:hypothetical protein